MKKTLLFKQLALAAALAMPLTGNGQKMLTEDFAYEAGNLVGQGGWTQILDKSTNPLQVIEQGLTYADYQDEAVGGAATFVSNGQDAYLPLGRNITSGDVYVSALVNLSAVQTGTYFFGFAQAEAASTNMRGKLFAKKSDNGKVQLGVSQQANSLKHYAGRQAQFATTEYDLNNTILVVMKYSFIEGEDNDLVSLYINPAIDGTEPENASITTKDEVLGSGDASSLGSIVIYQQDASASTGYGPTGTIDAIRVSTTWAGLFDDSMLPPAPEFTFAPSFMNIQDGTSYYVFVGETYPFTLNVKAENLTGDITVAVKGASNGEVTIETSTITKEQAESGTGFDLKGTLKPQDINNYVDTLLFTTAGSEAVVYEIYWTPAAPQVATTLADFKEQYAQLSEYEAPWVIFKLTGEVVVSHVYMNGEAQQLYIQDETGGVWVNDNLGSLITSYQAGDKLSNFLFTAESSFGSMYLVPTKDFGTPVSQNNAIEPVVLTLAELATNADRYYGCLVKVETVDFEMTLDGTGIVTEGAFGDEGLTVRIKQGDNSATINDLPGADFVGKDVPASARSITGISTSATGNAIAPRNLADIDADFESGEDPEPGTDPDEPGNEVEVGDNLFSNPSFEDNSSNPLFGAQFTDWSLALGTAAVEADILQEGEAAIYITGSGNAKLEQEIGSSAHTFTAGEAYALTMHYYVVKTQGDNDIQLSCAWEGVDVEAYDTAPLTQGFTGTVGAWESKRVRMVVPAGRQISFQFGLKVPSGAEVIFDDFSFRKLEAITTGIATPTDNGLVTWSEGGVLYLGSDRAQTVNVYSLNGVLVNRANLSTGVNTLALPAGAYLLQGGNGVQKVLVK